MLALRFDGMPRNTEGGRYRHDCRNSIAVLYVLWRACGEQVMDWDMKEYEVIDPFEHMRYGFGIENCDERISGCNLDVAS